MHFSRNELEWILMTKFVHRLESLFLHFSWKQHVLRQFTTAISSTDLPYTTVGDVTELQAYLVCRNKYLIRSLGFLVIVFGRREERTDSRALPRIVLFLPFRDWCHWFPINFRYLELVSRNTFFVSGTTEYLVSKLATQGSNPALGMILRPSPFSRILLQGNQSCCGWWLSFEVLFLKDIRIPVLRLVPVGQRPFVDHIWHSFFQSSLPMRGAQTSSPFFIERCLGYSDSSPGSSPMFRRHSVFRSRLRQSP